MLLHDNVMLHGKRDSAGGQEGCFGSGKISRLDLIKLVDVILNNYLLGKQTAWPPILEEGRRQEY